MTRRQRIRWNRRALRRAERRYGQHAMPRVYVMLGMQDRLTVRQRRRIKAGMRKAETISAGRDPAVQGVAGQGSVW